jgi:hypothetical protein
MLLAPILVWLVVNLEFFKNKTTEICHLDQRRHFEFYQKSSSMFFNIKVPRNTKEFFEKIVFLNN